MSQEQLRAHLEQNKLDKETRQAILNQKFPKENYPGFYTGTFSNTSDGIDRTIKGVYREEIKRRG